MVVFSLAEVAESQFPLIDQSPLPLLLMVDKSHLPLMLGNTQDLPFSLGNTHYHVVNTQGVGLKQPDCLCGALHCLLCVWAHEYLLVFELGDFLHPEVVFYSEIEHIMKWSFAIM